MINYALNTCFETTKDYHTIAYYTHLIPISITLLLTYFVLVRSRFSLLSKAFSLFSMTFCFWFIGSLITWTVGDYNLVAAIWSPLDLINIEFYLFGVYFFFVFINENDASLWQKAILLVLALPAWWITVSNNSIGALNQPQCEAFNSELLSNYKLGVEVAVVAFIMFYALIRGRKCDLQKKWRIFIVTLALVLFFSVFSVTEYISSQTGVYEINLYSLFVLPVFLFMIIFAITNLEIFKIRLIGFQLLAYVLIILVGSQIFFIQSSTSKFLTGITFVLSLGFGILLIRSGRREEAARTRAEKLAVDLEQANQQKDAILRMVAHQFRRPVTEINYMTELLLDGTYGPISAEQRESITTIQTASAKMGSQSELVLDAAKITSGKLPIVLAPLDLNVLLTEIVSTAEKYAKELKVQWKVSALPTLPTVMLDRKYTQSALDNLLNNAIKYTALKRTDGSGTVAFTVEQKGQVLSCSVQDNGIGIPEAEKEKMFKELSRASNAGRDGNGLGLHVAKGAIEAQGGSIRFESTVNVGTTFFVTLPLNVATKEDFLLQAAKEKEESNSKRGK